MKRWIQIALLTVATSAPAFAQPFKTLQAGYTQELFATTNSFVGGIAFAKNGDVWTNTCQLDSGPVRRFEVGNVKASHGASLHNEKGPLKSNAGCGMANHPDGFLYSNTTFNPGGVARLDPTDGHVVAVLGPAGNSLGLAVDPQSHHIVYAADTCRFTGSCPILDLDPTSGKATTIVTLDGKDADYVDGIYFDPTGAFLFLAVQSPKNAVAVVNRAAGKLVQMVPVSSAPDGIAFHTSPPFVVTSNTDGTLAQLTFAGGDYTQAPTVTTFATGGFRGDLVQVGPDGCLYVSQDGARYPDGTVTEEGSVVRVCGDFAKPPGVGDDASCDLAITCPAPATLECAGTCGTKASFSPTTMATCGPATTSCAPTSGTCFAPGTTAVACTATDAKKNKKSCGFSVKVVDTIAPKITMKPPIRIKTPDHKLHAYKLSQCASVTDICDGPIDIDARGVVSRILQEDSPYPDDYYGTCGDINPGNDPAGFEVRHETPGAQGGRIYYIDFYVTDKAGNKAWDTCKILIAADDDNLPETPDSPPGCCYYCYGDGCPDDCGHNTCGDTCNPLDGICDSGT